MKKLFTLLAFFLVIVSPLIAQKKFSGNRIANRSARSLSTNFRDYALFSINTADIATFTTRNRGAASNFELELPGLTSWKLSLTEHDILSSDYTLTVNSGSERITLPKPACMTYWGTLSDVSNSRVSLTITSSVIYGLIRNGNEEYFIEPLNYFDRQSSADLFVVYKASDVMNDGSLTCGVTEMAQRGGGLNRTEAGLNCVRTQVAIASDESMFIRYGSVGAVQTHNIGVMNNVIWDYVNNQFSDNIEFQILTQNVSTGALFEQLTPAYTGTDCDVILPNFRTWANAGGFGTVAHDLGQFWSTRNFDNDGAGGNNGIIGLAYVGVICTGSRYQILEDFVGSVPTGSGYRLRVLTSHETGHNFGCSHDGVGTPFIMAPSVQNTSIWSPASVATVDANVPGYVCLTTCATATPAVNFISSPEAVCTGGTIQLTDRTLNGPTSWAWVMAGGTPAVSAVRNPTVTYATTGIKTVTLTATNGMGPGAPVSRRILVSAAPAAACGVAGVIASNAGVQAFELNNTSSSSGGATADGDRYADRTCTNVTSLMTATSYTASVIVGTSNPVNTFNHVRFYIDYNNDGDFGDVNEVVYSSGGSAYIGNHSFSFTTPVSAVVSDQFLRARIIAADFGSAANPCHTPIEGQVEDFSVFFGSSVLLSASKLDFDGYHQNGVNILNWKAYDEWDNNYFDIERSFDGITFSPIGRVTSRITGTNNYTFTDPLTGALFYSKVFYRLRIAELSGSEKYSNIVPITMKNTRGEVLVSLHPNPFIGTFTTTLQLNTAGTVRMQLFDVAGRLVSQSSRDLPSGINTINWSGLETLSKGIYLLKLHVNNETITRMVESQ